MKKLMGYLALMLLGALFGVLHSVLGAPVWYIYRPYSNFLLLVLLAGSGSCVFIVGNWVARLIFMSGYVLLVFSGYMGITAPVYEGLLFCCAIVVIGFSLWISRKHYLSQHRG